MKALQKAPTTIETPLAISAVRERLKDLETLAEQKLAAQVAFSEAVKASAKKAKIEPSVLSSYIMARVQGTLEKKQRAANQLTLLFEEFGG